GATVADVLGSHHDTTNVAVATDIDVPAFNAWFMSEVATFMK
ncbi:MAG: ribonucleoside hydrolase RihC, partial [Weissella confusa]|nr:ribonucleoside hydrolase RihC [Weissella confusa]